MLAVPARLVQITPEQLYMALHGVSLGPHHSHAGQTHLASMVGKLA